MEGTYSRSITRIMLAAAIDVALSRASVFVRNRKVGNILTFALRDRFRRRALPEVHIAGYQLSLPFETAEFVRAL